jgi:hypothetical protein
MTAFVMFGRVGARITRRSGRARLEEIGALYRSAATRCRCWAPHGSSPGAGHAVLVGLSDMVGVFAGM